MQIEFGDNWDKSVDEKQLKDIILSILGREDLIMSKIERNRWKNKMYYEHGKERIFRIFYDTEHASNGLRLNKKNRDYK
jgi:hypothetical protein